ncbi:hypothetical protein DFH27DRAFT_526701 [Peziza echinospora]|nr:hypothetical protein DFH27DRAFT_526701 [Peziza echinospora]
MSFGRCERHKSLGYLGSALGISKANDDARPRTRLWTSWLCSTDSTMDFGPKISYGGLAVIWNWSKSISVLSGFSTVVNSSEESRNVSWKKPSPPPSTTPIGMGSTAIYHLDEYHTFSHSSELIEVARRSSTTAEAGQLNVSYKKILKVKQSGVVDQACVKSDFCLQALIEPGGCKRTHSGKEPSLRGYPGPADRVLMADHLGPRTAAAAGWFKRRRRGRRLVQRIHEERDESYVTWCMHEQI